MNITPRERQMLQAVADGYTTDQELSAALKMSTWTIKHHWGYLFDKLGLSNRMEVMLSAIKNNVVQL